MAEVILITSGKGGVGKSVVCGCLGAALASLEKQVLLLVVTIVKNIIQVGDFA